MSTAPESERLARAALSRAAEPGEHAVLRLVQQLGPLRARDHVAREAEVPDLESDLAHRLSRVDAALELERAERQGIRFVVPGDSEWPSRLAALRHVDPVQGRGGVPLGLWVTGPLTLDVLERPGSPGVAVVGSRSCTTYGAEVAREIAADLARAGAVVVSGAAFGIDQAAHRGAIAAGGVTVAVLACGVDRVYPSAHTELVRHVRNTAAVVSETPPGGTPQRIRFLARNRLIAALCTGTVLVEAAIRSGALNTANWTERLNRVLMGVPGPVTSAASQGVHGQLRSGAATLVSNGAEVLELLGASGEHLLVEPRAPERPRDRLERRHHRVLEAVPVGRPAEVDSVATAAGMKVLEVQSCLDKLQVAGFVEERDTGWVLGERGR